MQVIKIALCLFLLVSSVTAFDTLKVQNTTDITDTYMRKATSGTNYGGADTIRVYNFSIGSDWVWGIIGLGNMADSLSGKQVVEIKVFMYVKDTPGLLDPVIYLRPICKPFYESNATADDWHSPDSEWTSQGAGAGSGCADSCIFNSGDGTGCDCSAAGGAENKTLTSDSDGTYVGWILDTTEINKLIRGEQSQLVYKIINNDGNGSSAVFRSSEHASAPYFQILHQDQPGEGVPNYRQGPDGGAVRQSPEGSSVRQGPD